MKMLLLYCFLALVVWQAISLTSSYVAKKTPVKQTITDTISFANQVQPVLIKNCSPCHFPGGKMYERLPFDKEITLTNNADKILKRVEKDEKKAIVKEFILQIKNGLH
jgi:hypothetical protein